MWRFENVDEEGDIKAAAGSRELGSGGCFCL
jgi:hypothetical protein